MTCRLCGSPLAGGHVHGDWLACDVCGLVQNPDIPQDARPVSVSDGWHTRAAHVSAITPKHAVDAGRVSIDRLARLLEAGPLYVETPNTREPSLSLAHFFRARVPVYYEPATLSIALAMAGAEEIDMDEVAGMVTCVAVGGGQRMTYAEAVAATEVEVPQDVGARMLAHFAPKPPEVLGDVVPGACFLCGGFRRAWRSVAICVECSALTTQSHGHLLDELAMQFSTADGKPVQFFAPDMRSTSPDDCERVTAERGVLLDEAGWVCAMSMTGADQINIARHNGVMRVQGRTLGGPPRTKTYREARDVVIKPPPREARHTLAVWNTPPPQPSRYELWIAGDDEPDQALLRAEAMRDRMTAGAALEALESTMRAMEAKQDDPDDWHADPYLCGYRMGEAAAWRAAQSAVTSAWLACVERAVRDE